MRNLIKHLPTGKVYANRKQAKKGIGHSKFNKALRDGQMLIVTSYAPNDIIIN